MKLIAHKIKSLTALAVMASALGLGAMAYPAYAQNILSVTSPGAGAVWTQGSTQTIMWSPNSSSFNSSPTVFINLNPGNSCAANTNSYTCPANNGMIPYVIAQGVPNSGIYSWQLPSYLTAQYYQQPVSITVGLSDSSAEGTSSPFTILASGSTTNAITITSPTTGQQWNLGNSQNIQWSSNNSSSSSPANVSLQLVPVGSTGSSIYTVASNISNNNSYSLNLNNYSSGQTITPGQYTLNLIDPSSGAILGTTGAITINNSTSSSSSSTAFSISALSPNSGPVGTTVNIIGTGLPPSGNTINFGTGTYLNNISSINGNTTLQFTVPSQTQPCPPTITTACNMGTAALIQPGAYGVSVSSSTGTSNTLPFTVTANGTPATTTPTNPTTPTNLGVWAEGSVVKTQDSPTVYLVRNGILIPFTNPQIFFALGYQWANVQNITDQDLSQHTTSSGFVQAPTGSIIKSDNSSTLYYVSNGMKRQISTASLSGMGLGTTTPIVVSNNELNTYLDGPSL